MPHLGSHTILISKECNPNFKLFENPIWIELGSIISISYLISNIYRQVQFVEGASSSNCVRSNFVFIFAQHGHLSPLFGQRCKHDTVINKAPETIYTVNLFCSPNFKQCVMPHSQNEMLKRSGTSTSTQVLAFSAAIGCRMTSSISCIPCCC